MGSTTLRSGRLSTSASEDGSSLMTPAMFPASRSVKASGAFVYVLIWMPFGARFASAQSFPVVPFCTPTTASEGSWSVVVMSGVFVVFTVSDCRAL